MTEPAVHNAEAEAVRATAVRLWPDLLRTVSAVRSLSFTGPDAVRGNTFGAVDEQGRSLTVRLDAVPLPGDDQVRVFANTTSDHHVIQLSDRLPLEQVGPTLACGAAELMAVRRWPDTGRTSCWSTAGDAGTSRLLPADLFDAATATMVSEHGLAEAPPESGNVAAGFMATALQAKHRTDDRGRTGVRTATAPDRDLG
jgi:hypothetical protein